MSDELRNIDQEKAHALTLLQRIEQEAKECADKLDIPEQNGYDILAVMHGQVLLGEAKISSDESEQGIQTDEYDAILAKHYAKLFAQYIITSANEKRMNMWDMIKEILVEGYKSVEEDNPFDESSFQDWLLQAARTVIQEKTLCDDNAGEDASFERVNRQVELSPPKKDFFISYSRGDHDWAQWIGYQLEEAGYTCLLQKWDFQPGGNFVLDMQDATISTKRTIAVLSPDYLAEYSTQVEWIRAYIQKPGDEGRKLIPVRVRDCEPDASLNAYGYIDLVGQDEQGALNRLLTGVARRREKPTSPPRFPGTTSSLEKPTFEVFFSYAPSKDEELRESYHFLHRLGKLSRAAQKIGAGGEWAGEIYSQLHAAHVIVLLVGAAFGISDSHDVAAWRIITEREPGHANIIPVKGYPVSWHRLPFQVLYEKPVSAWYDREAYVGFANDIDGLLKKRWKK